MEYLALNRNLHLHCKALGTLRSQKECKSCRMGEEQSSMSSGRYRPTELKIWRQSVQGVPLNICITEDRRAQNVLEGNQLALEEQVSFAVV